MGELARRAGVSKQAMTTLVRSVEAAGLVARERDPDDARAYRITLSPRGQALRPVAEQVLGGLAAWARQRLSDADLELVVNSLRKVVDS
jgi:DNA-binding MarR family transcriptional regulator